MKQFLLNIILGVALILPFRSHTQDTEAIIRERVDANETPGIVVAVYENGKTQFYSFGYADVASKRPPGPKTLFEIGSITKTFTTTSLALLAEEGKLSLSDPVQKFLPDSVKAPERDGKSITLVDLATARSGLPRMPSNMKPADEENPSIDYDVQKMFAFLSGYTLTREIGSQYEYSNFGMGLLGVVIARIEHKSYSEVITTKILKPLQMKNTYLNTPERKDKDVATGYSGKKAAKHWTWTDQSSIQGAGGLLSNADDMVNYLVANLEPQNNPLGRAMTASHQPRNDAGRETMKIGLGWHIRNNIVWHNGGTGGFRTFAGFDPKKHKAVVVLTNSTMGADDLGFHLLDASIPLKKIRKTVAIDQHVLEVYPGTYQITPAFGIDVTLEKDQLFIQATGQSKAEAYPESDTKFFLKVVDAQIEFVRNEKGDVEKLILYQNGQALSGKKTK